MDDNTYLPQVAPAGGALVEVEGQRAIQEVQAAMIIAKKVPRDQRAAVDRILQAFSRPKLAESALYSYSRGGTEVTGPSIRAAETIAQQWGNLQFGVRELEQRNGESTVEAFAWDVETNTRQVKVFQVPHVRYRRPEKGGSVKLDDPRDIYEMVANQGARRLRACILGVIPGDVIEDAIHQAEVTLKTKVIITPELLQSLLDKFAEHGINKEMIEKRIQRRFDAITPALIVNLGKVYNSLRDGMSTPAEWFDVPKTEGEGAGAKGAERGVAAFMDKTKVDVPPEPPAQPAPPPDKPDGPLFTITIKDVRKLIDGEQFDEAADMIRSFPAGERAALEVELKRRMAKAAT